MLASANCRACIWRADTSGDGSWYLKCNINTVTNHSCTSIVIALALIDHVVLVFSTVYIHNVNFAVCMNISPFPLITSYSSLLMSPYQSNLNSTVMPPFDHVLINQYHLPQQGIKPFQACSIFVGAGLSSLSLVDSCFLHQSEGIHALTSACMYCSFVANVLSAYICRS